MLNDELINFITEEAVDDKTIIRKLDNGLKVIEEALGQLDSYIVSCVPKLFLSKEISKIEKYSDLSDYLKQDIESIQTTSNKLHSILDTNSNTALKLPVPDEALELYILDVHCRACCEKELAARYTAVHVFNHENEVDGVRELKNVWTKYCSICGKHYVYPDVAKSLISSLGESITINSTDNKPEVSKEPQFVNVSVIEKTKICPLCNNDLNPEKISYYVYFDKELKNYNKTYELLGKRCGSCNELFITASTYDLFKRQGVIENSNIKFVFLQNQYEHIKAIVYIQRGKLKCNLIGHTIECVTAIVKSINGKDVQINIDHCKFCDKYYINETSLENYERLYGVLLFNREPDPSMVEYFGSYGRSSKSPLKIHGYTVREGALSATQRNVFWLV